MRYDDDSRPHVWVACTDLTGARQLPTPSGLDVGWAVWSPDGKRIAFNAGHDDPDVDDALEPWDIYTMDRDGGDIRKLTNATALNGDPGYSPDGTLIAYDSTETGKEGIWVMDAEDGAHKRLVTPMPASLIQDYSPRFSPDGTRLVFAREVDSESEAALWTVNLDGTDLRRITPPGIYPEKSEWSPDGSRIVFDATKPGQTVTTIWVVGADGQGLTSLNTAPGDGTDDGYSKPTWSDDGSLIYLVHGIHPGPSRLGIAVMRPDGTGLRYVDDGTGYEHLPDWTATPC
jgi:Tol biopolymer transport system component